MVEFASNRGENREDPNKIRAGVEDEGKVRQGVSNRFKLESFADRNGNHFEMIIFSWYWIKLIKYQVSQELLQNQFSFPVHNKSAPISNLICRFTFQCLWLPRFCFFFRWSTKMGSSCFFSFSVVPLLPFRFALTFSNFSIFNFSVNLWPSVRDEFWSRFGIKSSVFTVSEFTSSICFLSRSILQPRVRQAVCLNSSFIVSLSSNFLLSVTTFGCS